MYIEVVGIPDAATMSDDDLLRDLGGYQVSIDKNGNATQVSVLPSGGSSGGGGGGGASSSKVSIEYAAHGKVKASPAYPKTGDTVTLTVTPDAGYELKSLVVKDTKGNEIKLTKVNDTTYTFIMPGTRVTVTPTFGEKSATTMNFTDVPAGWYYDAVLWAVEKGITTGTSATTFSPDNTCTRAEMVTFLWRTMGQPAPASKNNPFNDVPSNTYYTDAVLWAVEKGITKGTGDDAFSPNATVTRAQTVTFLHRAAGSPAGGNSSFADVEAGSYYAGAVQWALNEGITTGTSATAFSPNKGCTRAEIVTFLYRAYA